MFIIGVAKDDFSQTIHLETDILGPRYHLQAFLTIWVGGEEVGEKKGGRGEEGGGVVKGRLRCVRAGREGEDEKKCHPRSRWGPCPPHPPPWLYRAS